MKNIFKFKKIHTDPTRNATHNVAGRPARKTSHGDVGGYTIIETMVSIALFLVVVAIGMNSLLNANVVLNKAKDTRAIMDNLTFIMEDMSKNIRTGSGYRCSADLSSVLPQSCSSGGTISFREAITGARWAYSITSYDGGQSFQIYKTTDATAIPINWVELTDENIKLSNVSGFSVLGAEPVPADLQQPFVTIKLVGEMISKNVVTPFILQNSVSQTTIDIVDPNAL